MNQPCKNIHGIVIKSQLSLGCNVQDHGVLDTAFFIVVKTNMEYQIAGSFAVHDETANTITEALSLLYGW